MTAHNANLLQRNIYQKYHLKITLSITN